MSAMAAKARNLIVVPMRNSGLMIRKVMTEISKFDFQGYSLLFIDNCSTDGCLDLAREIVNRNEKLSSLDCIYMRNSTNLGYGGSITIAFEYAISNNFEWMCILHSDDQTDWFEVLKQIDGLKQNESLQVILGSRFISKDLTSSYNRKRLFGNQFFRSMTKALAGVEMSDPGAAIGAYRLEAFQNIDFSSLSSGFHFHPELNLIIAARNLKIRTFALRWKDASASNDLRLFRYGIHLLRFLFTVWSFRKLRRLDLENAVLKASKRGYSQK